MARTAVSMCNAAVRGLGSFEKITALSDGTPLGDLFGEIFQDTVDEELEANDWNFAIKRVPLSASDGYPSGVDNYTLWQYRWEVPSDCLRPLECYILYPQTTAYPPMAPPKTEIPFANEHGVIYTNYDETYLRYVKYVSNPEDFDGLFAQAIICMLKMKAAPAIVEKENAVTSAAGEYSAWVRRAKGKNAIASGQNLKEDIAQWWRP